MAVRRARRFDVLFGEMFPWARVTGLWPVDLGGNGKPPGGGGSGDASAQGARKAA
ncbi:MAG: hypothetical protein ACRDRW_18805 [Pseudonocardiaceae bacterium]